MVKNTSDKFYSKAAMGRAASRSITYIEGRKAEHYYQNILDQFSPDVLVQNGGPTQEIARERAKGLGSNAHYFAKKGDKDFDILTPEEEYGWAENILENAAENHNSHVYFSEQILERGLETALDDVLSVHKMSLEGDNILYHTSSAHARAMETAAKEVHGDKRQYQIFGFGNDPFTEHVKHGVFNKIYQKVISRKTDF